MENKENEVKKCKHCQSDIPKKAKICPNCRKKQGGKLKFIIAWIFLIIIAIASIGGGDGSGKKDDSENISHFSAADPCCKNTLHCWHGTERSGCIMLDDFLIRRSCF